MSKLFSRIVGYIKNRSLMGMDKAGNQYFVRTEEIDGISKWVSSLNPLVAFSLFWDLGICYSLCVCTFVSWVLLQLR